MVLRRRARGGLLLTSQEGGIDDRLMVDPERLRDDILGLQINTQLSGVLKQIAAGVAVALGELIHELLNAKRGLGQHDLLFVLGDHHLLVESSLECFLEVGLHRKHFLGPSRRMRRRTARLPCVLLRRTPRADLVCVFVGWIGLLFGLHLVTLIKGMGRVLGWVVEEVACVSGIAGLARLVGHCGDSSARPAGGRDIAPRLAGEDPRALSKSSKVRSVPSNMAALPV
jgi:hypothetical protein